MWLKKLIAQLMRLKKLIALQLEFLGAMHNSYQCRKYELFEMLLLTLIATLINGFVCYFTEFNNSE